MNNKIYILFLISLIHTSVVSNTLIIDENTKHNDIDYSISYVKVTLKNISTSKIYNDSLLRTKNLDIDECLVDSELNKIFEPNVVKNFVMRNSVISEARVSLSFLRQKSFVRLKNISSKSFLMDLDNVNRFHLIQSENIIIDVNDLNLNIEEIIFKELNYNNIKSIERINEFTQLQFLAIYGYKNELNLINLRNLKILSLSDLEYFPNLGKLQLIENFMLNNINNYESNKLNDFIYSHRNTLKELTINNLRLKKITKSILSCKKLKSLNLNDNLIDNIPNEIKYLENLEMLSLRNNIIEDINLEILKLGNLSYLNIEKNAIKNLKNLIYENEKVFIQYD